MEKTWNENWLESESTDSEVITSSLIGPLFYLGVALSRSVPASLEWTKTSSQHMDSYCVVLEDSGLSANYRTLSAQRAHCYSLCKPTSSSVCITACRHGCYSITQCSSTTVINRSSLNEGSNSSTSVVRKLALRSKFLGTVFPCPVWVLQMR